MKIISSKEPVTDKELKLKDFCRENGLEFTYERDNFVMVEVYKIAKAKKSIFDYFFKEGHDIPFKENKVIIGNIYSNMGSYHIRELELFLKFVNIYEKIYEVEIEVKL